MKDFRYLDGVTTLSFDAERCVGCGMCEMVCPHGVFQANGKKVELADRDGCMECGACSLNCPTQAISVNPGVGCALAIIHSWFKGKEAASCGGTDCC